VLLADDPWGMSQMQKVFLVFASWTRQNLGICMGEEKGVTMLLFHKAISICLFFLIAYSPEISIGFEIQVQISSG